ncbi:MAG: hypothetical protein HLX51_00420 [Micrococcaceae bacterium]|nr:hypothetical protein [Micrococcaceae bacterium]
MRSDEDIKVAVATEMTELIDDVEPLSYHEVYEMDDDEIQRAKTFERRATATITFDADDHIVIPRPHIPHGPKQLTADASDVQYLREAAQKIQDFYKPFGSNLRATIVKLIDDAADAIEAASKDRHDAE